MSKTVIDIEHLFKEYRLGVIDSGYLIRDIQTWWAKVRGKDDPNSLINSASGNKFNNDKKSLLALNDVNLEIKEGEVLGIIGRNGAGKSTLLKILSRVTAPTKGQVKIKGRVGSLLEVGTGFHPELTGRDNIYLNGAILGMRKHEISKKLDEIVAFAEIEKFLDTPVKRYSSGMYVRLAFAVAAHLDTEILIVDEVLAVGDAEFQKKCLGKMGDVSKEGRTVLFVSHNMESIINLCQQGLLLSKGAVAFQGNTEETVSMYLERGIGLISTKEWDLEKAPGNDVVRLLSARIINDKYQAVERIDMTESVGIEMVYNIIESDKKLIPSFTIKNDKGLYGFNCLDTNPIWNSTLKKGFYKSIAWLPRNLLNEGMFEITIVIMTLHSGKTTKHVLENGILSFQVLNQTENSAKGKFLGQWTGVVSPKLDWELEINNC